MKLAFIAAAFTAVVLSVSLARGEAAKPPVATARPETITLSSNSSAAHQIATAPAVRKKLTGIITATATIEPDIRKVAHVSPRTQARVVKLVADLGQYLKPGDAIAILSSVELGKAKADYLKAKSLEGISAQHLAREERLFKDKIAAQRDVLEARANHETAHAQYKTAREALLMLIPEQQVNRLSWSSGAQNLSEFPLVAPIAGTLVKRDLTVGQIVNDDAEVATVIDLDTLWVMASVFEHDVGGLKIGAPANIVVDAYPNEKFQGKVAYIGDTVERSTRSVQARIEVPNPGHLLKPGMFARAEIASEHNTREVVTAPASAVFEVAGHKAVFVQTGAGKYEMKPVTLGAVGHDDVEILSGLHEGEKVVTKGGLVLKAMLVNRVD